MKIYLAGPMTGLKMKEVEKIYSSKVKDFQNHYEIYHPMICNEVFECSDIQNSEDLISPTMSSDSIEKSILKKDEFFVRNCDIVFADFSYEKPGAVSIGTVSEIAWGHILNKKIVVVMPEGSCHNHAFIKQQSWVIFKTYEEAKNYLVSFSRKDFTIK